MTAVPSTPRPIPEDRFLNSESLRCLLCQLHEAGNRAWAHHPDAADLMQFVHDKYAALARRHELDP